MLVLSNRLAFLFGLGLCVACESDRPDFSSAETGSTDLSETDAAPEAESTDDAGFREAADTDGELAGGTDEAGTSTDVGAGPAAMTTDSDPPGAPTPGENEGADPAEFGAPCTRAQQCASNFCVDGVCCESACADVCSTCDGAGTEGACVAAQQDDACGALACPEDTECRTYDSTDVGNCDGVGLCATIAACAQVDVAGGTACQNGVGSCDGGGECVVPNKLGLGEICSSNDECGSDFCALTAAGDSVCCNQACDGVCAACGTDGFCDDFPSDDARCDAISCAADSTCADYPDPLTTDRCSAFGQCVTQAAHCVASFANTSTSCGAGQFCDGAGACDDACSASETWCTDTCVDLDTDDDNCGMCGNPCPSGSSCVSGACECPGVWELLCSDVCVDIATDVDNCGDCDEACPAPTEPGSSAVCADGLCSACGGYGQDCCGSSCGLGLGLACVAGECDCAADKHRCTTGPFSEQCRDDDDELACGLDCADCTQPNAVAVCSGGSCDNACAPGVVELCPNNVSTGFAYCGAWSFESGALEGWDLSSSYSGSSTVAYASTGDLTPGSVAVTGDGDWTTGADLRVRLCGGTTSLAGLRLSFSIRYGTTPNSDGVVTVALNTTQGVILGAGPVAFGATLNGTGWTRLSTNFSSLFAPNASALAAVSELSIRPEVQGGDWTGTIYIDDVVIDQP